MHSCIRISAIFAFSLVFVEAVVLLLVTTRVRAHRRHLSLLTTLAKSRRTAKATREEQEKRWAQSCSGIIIYVESRWVERKKSEYMKCNDELKGTAISLQAVALRQVCD